MWGPDASTETQVEGKGHQHPLGTAGCPTLEQPCPSATVTAPVLGGFHGQGGRLLLFHCSWGHEDLGEESLGSQRKSNLSGVHGLHWFMSLLRLPKIPQFLKRSSNSLVLPLRDFKFFFPLGFYHILLLFTIMLLCSTFAYIHRHNPIYSGSYCSHDCCYLIPQHSEWRKIIHLFLFFISAPEFYSPASWQGPKKSFSHRAQAAQSLQLTVSGDLVSCTWPCIQLFL